MGDLLEYPVGESMCENIEVTGSHKIISFELLNREDVTLEEGDETDLES